MLSRLTQIQAKGTDQMGSQRHSNQTTELICQINIISSWLSRTSISLKNHLDMASKFNIVKVVITLWTSIFKHLS